MPDVDLKPDIEALKAANVDLKAKLAANDANATKIAELEARFTVQQQEISDLRAEIQNTTNLGKSSGL